MPTMPSPMMPESSKSMRGRNPTPLRSVSPTQQPVSTKPPLKTAPVTPNPSLRGRYRSGTPPPRSTRQPSPTTAKMMSTPSTPVLKSPRYVSEGSERTRRVMLSAGGSRTNFGDDRDGNDPLGHANSSHSHGGLKSPRFPVASGEKEGQTRVVEVTEFHKCIYAKDWPMLEKCLKKFNGNYYRRMKEKAERQREKSELQLTKDKSERAIGADNMSVECRDKVDDATSTPRQLSARMLAFLPRSLSNQRLLGDKNCEEKVVVSPLLKVDEEGRTPLHVAYMHQCPDTILLDLQNEERLAARVKDNYGQLPLHLAMLHEFPEHLIEKLIKGHANALKTKDLAGRSPLGYGVELATKEQDERYNDGNSAQQFQWGKPVDDAEKAWQYAQIKAWRKVDFLLKDLMRRKKSLLPSEHGLLAKAIEARAPNKVINRFISTTDKYLTVDDDFAGTAISLCVTRQYALDTLEYLVANCKAGSTVVQDYTEKALTTHYRRGCQPVAPELLSFGKEIVDWCKGNPNIRSDDDNYLSSGAFLSGTNIKCQEWWEMLRYLIFLAAYGKDFASSDLGVKDMHILHAALSISSTQPSLVQLLLVIFPESQNELCPLYKVLPVHLICTRWRYDALRSDKDASMEKVVKMFLKADKEQVLRRHKSRLPLHMALLVGQSWSFVKPFIHFDKAAVGMRDPHTKMFPFQLAAVKVNSKSLAMMLRHRYTPIEWNTIHHSQKQMEFGMVREQQARRQLGTIYELLRRHPYAVAGKYLLREAAKMDLEIHRAGPISMHYLSSLYHPGETGWKLDASFAIPLRDSIMNGFIVSSLTTWWNQMKDYIWETTPSDMIPVSDEYLLHAALYNPDTPPVIIELLIALFPTSSSNPVPGTKIYPIHIAAGTIPYQPQKVEAPYSISSLELTLNANKTAVTKRVNGQLPIHMALSRGKTWKHIEPLIRQDPQSLLVQDPISKLTPVELMASFRISSFNNMQRFAQVMDSETRDIDLDELTGPERAHILSGVQKNFSLDVLSTIFELLRRAPCALIPQQQGIPNNRYTVSSGTNPIPEVSDHASVAAGNELLQRFHDTAAFVPRRRVSLALYLEGPSLRDDGSVDLPLERSGLSLSSLVDEALQGANGSSSLSLNDTASAPPIHDEYTYLSYNDENFSSMGASENGSSRGGSVASSGATSPMGTSKTNVSSNTPGTSGSRKIRGSRRTNNRSRLPNIPNLEETGRTDSA